MQPIYAPWFIISLLGALNIVTPFAIDMYLPAFPLMAKDFGVDSSLVALTVSGYFIGYALGQVIYGPLLDRFGRKRPLYVGLAIFIVASIGCAMAQNVYTLTGLRFIQGFGGCVTGVASTAMVRDFFPVKDSARIFSLLFLFIASSPLLAPSIGGFLMVWIDWRTIFVTLATMATLILTLIYFKLPEGHKPDPSISLRPLPILLEYVDILKNARFTTYTLAGGFAFAGLFSFVAGAPIVFMENFHLTSGQFSIIFAILAGGFIGGSQINVLLLRKYDSAKLFLGAVTLQVLIGAVFTLGTWLGWYGLIPTMALFFIFLACAGTAYPNAAALAISPFKKYAGSAAALLGFLQMGTGALLSTGITLAQSRSSLPIIALLATTSTIGFIIVLIGRKRAETAESEAS